MKASFTTVPGLMTALLAPTLASPLASPLKATPKQSASELKERQFLDGLLIAAITGAGQGLLNSFLGPEQPGCTWKSTHDDQNWWTRVYQEVNGQNNTIADVCWTQGGYTFTDNDISAAQCLVNLHVSEDASCMDLAGSSCESGHDGTAIGNVRVMYSLSTDANQQLDQTNGDLANQAISVLTQLQHGFDITTNVDMALMNSDQTYTSWMVQLRGTGDENC